MQQNRMPPFDFDALREVQEPVDMPTLPVVMCAQCRKPVTIRINYDMLWAEYVVAMSCHGEVQGVALRATAEGMDYPLIFSLIEGLRKVFQPVKDKD